EFARSKYRLCMWNIIQKLPAKICAKIYDETDFKEKLNKIIWNMYIGPEEFEYRWGKLMEEFKLENHKWLTKMFNICSSWILAYFIDSPLCGLMRTTSRSKGSDVCIIKESPYVYEMPKKKKKPQSLDKGKDKAEEDDTVDMFFKKDGLYKPAVVDVKNPTVGSTKGRRKLRIKGGKDKAIEKSLKGRNSCSLCGGTDHNKRTCPGRFEVEDEVVVKKEVCQEEVVQEKVDLAEDEEQLVEEYERLDS
nr:protein FAR1-related sequence 5-like [Tanacetum cinerariifolium]